MNSPEGPEPSGIPLLRLLVPLNLLDRFDGILVIVNGGEFLLDRRSVDDDDARLLQGNRKPRRRRNCRGRNRTTRG